MGFFDKLSDKLSKVIEEEKLERLQEEREEKLEKKKQELLDTLRNPMRTCLRKDNITDNEINFLKTTAAKIGIEAADFEMRFEMVRSAKKAYYDTMGKKGLFSSKNDTPDLFFCDEDEIEDYFMSKMGGISGMLSAKSELGEALAERKIEAKVEQEMQKPHFESAFDEAFPTTIIRLENQEEQPLQQTQTTPPPTSPEPQYTLNINGQNQGPYNMQQMQQMVLHGQITTQTYVWKQGMANWELAGKVQELATLFGAVPPPPPGMPPMPPTM